MVTLAHTAQLDAASLVVCRDLMDAAFDDFSDHDWEHALGGMHALVRGDDEVPLAHGSLVQRRLLVAGRAVRCGYVEAVATHPDHRRHGHASAVMAELEELAGGYDVLALSASDAGRAMYLARGWEPWRGRTGVLSPDGRLDTPDDDGSVLVLGGAGLDLDAPIACDWREGDVW